MLKCFKSVYLLAFLGLTLFIGISQTVSGSVKVQNLQVEYSKTPIGIDIKTPHFSWQMNGSEGERNLNQSAYQIVVKDLEYKLVWDTKRVTDNKSLGIRYAGSAIKAATRYIWTVTVWDQKGKSGTESSWFETGLMNPDPALSAWDGATWIGGSDDDLVLYSPYLAIFNLKYKQTIEKRSTRASFIYGANDSRLLNKFLNIFQVENKKNESYIRIELDISAVDGTENGKAKLNIYRVGYKGTDSPTTPLKTFEVQTKFIDNSNKNSELNGKRVGDDYYNPGLSQYNITHFYQTYDVTGMVKPGENAIGAVISEGWWSSLLSFGSIWNHFGDRQTLLAKLVIT